MIGRKKGRGRRGAGEGGGGGKKIIYLNGSVPVPQLIITSCSLMTKYSRKLYSLLVHVYTLRVLYGHLVSHKFYIFELKLISISLIFLSSAILPEWIGYPGGHWQELHHTGMDQSARLWGERGHWPPETELSHGPPIHVSGRCVLTRR